MQKIITNILENQNRYFLYRNSLGIKIITRLIIEIFIQSFICRKQFNLLPIQIDLKIQFIIKKIIINPSQTMFDWFAINTQQNTSLGPSSQSQHLSIFTDVDSPFATAPQKVKQILLSAMQNDSLETSNIDLNKLQFPLKIAAHNFCTHYFVPYQNQEYFTCDDCRDQKVVREIRFCKDCWQPQKHVGHQIKAKTGKGFCDCGRIDRFKKQSICAKHSDYDKIKECEIPQKQGDQFKSAILSLLECAVYLQMDQTLFNKIAEYLNKLNQNSVYYNRLTFDIVSTQSKYLKQSQIKKLYNQNSFLIIFSKYVNQTRFNIFLAKLCGDLLARKKLVMFMCEISDQISEYRLFDYIKQQNLRYIINPTVIYKLFEQNFANVLFDSSIRKMKEDMRNKMQIQFTQIRCKNLKSLKQLQRIQYILFLIKNPQVAKQLLVRIFQLYPSSEDIIKMMDEQQQKNKKQGQKTKQTIQQLKQTKQLQYRYRQLPQIVKNANNSIMRLFPIADQGQINNTMKMRQILNSNGAKPQKIDNFLYWITMYSYQIFIENNKKWIRTEIITLISLMESSDSNQQLLNRFWNFLLKGQNKMGFQFDNLKKLVQYIHLLIANVFLSELNFVVKKIRNVNIQLLPNSQIKILDDFFRNYLHENKIIAKGQIEQLKYNQIINVKNANIILNQLCLFNYQTQNYQLFTYQPCNQSNEYKYGIRKFPNKLQMEQNYEKLFINTLYFGKQIIFYGPFSKKLIQFVLKSNQIIPILDKKWDVYKGFEYKNVEDKCAYLYFFILVLYDCLTKGYNKQLHQRLQNLRDNKQALKQYTEDQQELKMIYRLFEKQKIAENGEYKQKTCIQCNQEQKPQNLLYNVCSIDKNNKISKIIQIQNNSSSFRIYTCFHKIHLLCYKSLLKKKNKEFDCPICRSQRNCILPIQYNKEKKQMNRMISRYIMISMLMNYKIYDSQNIFILIFKHLVESSGLNCLIQETFYKQNKEKCAKNDSFLEKMMTDIYEGATEQDRQQYLQNIDHFIAQVSKCAKTQCRLIQLLFAEILRNIFTKSEPKINRQVLCEIRVLLEEGEFAIIKQNAERLVGESGQNGENYSLQLQDMTEEQKAKPKTRLGFTLLSLPQNAKQALNLFKQKCQICNDQENQHICLICGSLTCYQCNKKHFSQVHKNFKFYLSRGTLNFQWGDYGIGESVYYNDSKIPYDGREDKISFKLDQSIYSHLLDSKFSC